MCEYKITLLIFSSLAPRKSHRDIAIHRHRERHTHRRRHKKYHKCKYAEIGPKMQMLLYYFLMLHDGVGLWRSKEEDVSGSLNATGAHRSFAPFPRYQYHVRSCQSGYTLSSGSEAQIRCYAYHFSVYYQTPPQVQSRV
jgi:hypothetical protein